MNIYILLYPLSGILGIVAWFHIYKKYHNISGFFMLLFTILFSSWYISYFLFFSGISNYDVLLLLSRSNFWTGIMCIYSLLFFVIFFHKFERQVSKKLLLILFLGFLAIEYIFIGGNWMIAGLEYDHVEKVYREVYGDLYGIAVVLYLIFLVSFVGFSIQQIKRLQGLNKVRFKYISFSWFLFFFTIIFLQVILPLFNIWILEKEVVFLALFFILAVSYSIKKYYFSSSLYGIGKWISNITALILSIVSVNVVKYFLTNYNSWVVLSYWASQDEYSIIDITFWVSLFLISSRLFAKIFLGDAWLALLKESIEILQKQISQLTDLQSLNILIQKEVENLFKTKVAYISLFQESNNEKSELEKFFWEKTEEKIFINDIVFIEENKDCYDKEKILTELSDEIFLMIPVHNSQNIVIGAFVLWSKPFGDFYTVEEIWLLKEFTFFLEIHLKYIRTYDKMTDLSKNLDKKVDEKTIEYNDLINKQKEFISMISHEVRSPIGSTIFQVDSLIEEFDYKEMPPQEIKKRLRSLCDQLVHIGELLKKLFSIQYFETRNVTLLKEKIDIWNLLEKEFSIYSRMYEDTTFINKIDQNIGFVDIDKIHFHQVLTNLLENAIKFADPENPSILIQSKRSDSSFSITIEDNWSWFGDMNPSIIFEKYTKGNHEKLWLWMWLYLCNRIISMHNGTLTVSHGTVLSGASFTIILPL